MKIEERFHVACRTCLKTTHSDDADKRDWLAVQHFQATGHKHFRRWTEDIPKP